MIGSYEEVRLIRRGPMSTRGSYEEVPSSFPPCPVEAAGAAGVLTTPMASADHRLAALVAAFAFAQVRSATLAVVRPGRAALATWRCCHSSNSFCCRRCRRPRSPRRRGAPRASPLSRPRWSAEASGQHVLPATPASATLAGSWCCASGSSPGRADGPAGASSSSRSSSTPCRCVAPAPLP